ncbi:MAG: hypothetical protein ABJP70_04235 [Erythrobacter sp.]
MRRKIVQPADLSGDALTEFKQWLGISQQAEDANLRALLEASLATCEAFIGQAPLEQTVEETIPAEVGETRLSSQPVRRLLNFEGMDSKGKRDSLLDELENSVIDVDGSAVVTIRAETDHSAYAITMVAGMSQNWSSTEGPLRQGIIRLAAYYYRDRSLESSEQPPASVAALWRPWRVLRLT